MKYDIPEKVALTLIGSGVVALVIAICAAMWEATR